MNEKERLQVSIRKLQAKGLSVPQIAHLVNDKAICRRTIYRWLNGDSMPKNLQHIERLEELVKQL